MDTLTLADFCNRLEVLLAEFREAGFNNAELLGAIEIVKIINITEHVEKLEADNSV